MDDFVRIRVTLDDDKYWAWCIETLKMGSWSKLVPIIGTTATYRFSNHEDATAFRLMFGV